MARGIHHAYAVLQVAHAAEGLPVLAHLHVSLLEDTARQLYVPRAYLHTAAADGFIKGL